MSHAFHFGQHLKRAFYLSPEMFAAGNLGTVAPPKRKKKKKPSQFDEARDELDRFEKEHKSEEQAEEERPNRQPGIPSAKLAAHLFGAQVRHALLHNKRAGMLGNFADGLNTSWNNASRVFKGGMGAIAGGLGAAGAGLAGGAMQGANAVGGLVGAQPFSNEAIDTAYGTADHYANAGSAYGKDLAQGYGMGTSNAGMLDNNPSYGDQYIKQVQQLPGVTNDARRVSNMAMGVSDFAANAAPAAALGAGAKVIGNWSTGAPLLHGVASTAPAPVAGSAAPAASAAARAAKNIAHVGGKLNSTSNPVGWSASAAAHAARDYNHYQPAPAQ